MRKATSKIIATIEELKLLKQQMKSYEVMVKNKEDEIKKFLESDDVLINEKGLILATYKLEERETIDSKLLKLENPDIWQCYARKSTFTKLLIK